MPKVGTIETRFRTKHPEKFEVWYGKQMFYIKGLPDEFITVTGFRNWGYPSEAELCSALWPAAQLYMELKTTERKVILFYVAASAQLRMKRVGEGSYQGQNERVSRKVKDMGFQIPECSIGLEYLICKEVTKGSPKYFSLNDDDTIRHEHSHPQKFTVIEWTEHRELFFENTYNAMQELLIKMSEFFTKDEAELTALMDKSAGNILSLNSPE